MKSIFQSISYMLLIFFNLHCDLAKPGSINPEPIKFIKTFGDKNADYGQFVQATKDGGYILCGSTESYGGSVNGDVFLLKTNAQGDSSWSKHFGGSFLDFSTSAQQTTDGGYIICGYTESFGRGGGDMYLIKTASDGSLQWQRPYGGEKKDKANGVQQTTDGGYIVCGGTYSQGKGDSDVYLLKINAIGDTIWTKTFGGIQEDYGYSVQQTTDGGYILGGMTKSEGAGEEDFYLIKTNALGDLQWTKTFGGTTNDLCFMARQTTDGGYILCGRTQSFGHGIFDIWVIKTKPNGELLWGKTWGDAHYDSAQYIQQTNNNEYIVCAESQNVTSLSDVYIYKLNANGEQIWENHFGGAGQNVGTCANQTNDGGYIICGHKTVSDRPDIYLIKTDKDGNAQ